MKENIEIIRSDRRSISVQITTDLRIIVRAPKSMSDADIQRFVGKKSGWIEKHIAQAKEAFQSVGKPFSKEEIALLAEQARADLAPRVFRYATLVGAATGRITIRCQHTRWGSCSGKNNLSFNCLLMLCPPEVRDYVVLHEVCHCLEHNHSPRFWAKVERYMPDYNEKKKWLRENEKTIIARVK